MISVVTRLFAVALMVCVVSSCGGSYRAPVEQRYTKPLSSTPSVYYVQQRDTLYSISWRYGLDYRTLASVNGIYSPYTIYPGQKLYLQKKSPVRKQTNTATPGTKKTISTPVAKKSASTRPPVSNGSVSPAATVKKTSSAKKASTTKHAGSGSKRSSTPSAKVTAWRWPTVGKVSRRYSASVHKGIDISGKRGDAIVAVAAGKVVYAGSGIVGYGDLLIIKHNEIYLSAYGHNSRLLVKEGEAVKVGQKIAEKGSSGTDTVKLHFEIRKEGKPVDPQGYLP